MNHRRFGDQPVGLVALHGFTQHGGSFGELATYLDCGLLAVDLPGHGSTDIRPVSFDVAVEVVLAVVEALPRPPALLGYSQGGRIALAVALARPESLDRLILVSTSAGIEDAVAAAERRRTDEALAKRIEDIGAAAFLEEWLAMDMFRGLSGRPPSWRAADRKERLENRAAGLAAALRGMGQGVQPYFGEQLAGLTRPVLVIAGSADARYRQLAVEMADRLPNGRAEIVGAAGHSVVGEQPERVAALVNAFVG